MATHTPKKIHHGCLIGSFDLFNAWHEMTLQTAGKQCDQLHIVITDGTSDTVWSGDIRAEMIAATHYVEHAGLFSATGVTPDVEVFFACKDQDLSAINLPANIPVVLLDVSMTESEASRLLKTRIESGAWSHYLEEKQCSEKIIQEHELASRVSEWKQDSIQIVTTNGSFDLLHPGHVRYLQEARSHGNLLIIMVNDDASIRDRKGNQRPVFLQQERMEALSMLRCVDWVVPFHGDNPLYMIDRIAPAVHVKGGSFEPERIAREKQLVESKGGKLITLELIGEFSSSHLIQNVRAMSKI
ncbi:MAG: adenylyltransferase/cytidyltransferase family protein [SAR324 cluster bacterium]|nr:adenylyltransferase/cytidyltransferase family protein [SAR324 cluster bacterium]